MQGRKVDFPIFDLYTDLRMLAIRICRDACGSRFSGVRFAYRLGASGWDEGEAQR